jgi:dermatan 4-sulfotransferase 1
MTLRSWYEDARKRYKIGRETPQLWFFEQAGFGYIQIPKVATRSIRAAFTAADGLMREGEEFDAFERRCSAHLTHAAMRQRVGDAPVFAFVRHPLARLHSAWMNKIVDAEREGERNILRCHGMHFGISFEAFVERVCELPDARIDRHLRSQAWFLADERGLLPTFIGRMENFSDDWAQLREQLPALGDIGHVNRAAFGIDHAEHYTPRMFDMAVERYADDFRLFGYTPQ